MSFGDHLDELRSCLIRALVGVGAMTALCFFIGRHILGWIYHPLLVVLHSEGLPAQLQVLSPTAAFTAYLKIGFLAGLILSMPWVLYQIWSFVASGLYAHERRFARMLLPASIGLFALGVTFLYFLVLPLVLRFFVSFNMGFPTYDLTPSAIERAVSPEPHRTAPAVTSAPLKVPVFETDPQQPQPGDLWVNAAKRRLLFQAGDGIVWSMPFEPGSNTPPMHSQFAIDFYISFVLLLALGFGLAFETPIVVFFLARSGIVPVQAMKHARRYVILAIVIAAAMLTPPDVISQLLLAGPMYLLFEVGVWVADQAERRHPKASG